MGKIDLQIKCRLENLDELAMKPDDDWYFVTECSHCHERSDNKIYFTLSEVQDLPGSKGQANYVAKCKLCERTSNVEYCSNSLRPYTATKNEQWQTIATFECRGMELVEFFPGNDFGCKGAESGSPFGAPHGEDPIEFDQGDWCGFDEEANDAVGIYELKSQFVSSKKK